ncbi:MAG: isoprenoid biosynthesis glyoxalase ElbB [Bacteroidia bacterium]
MPNKLKIGVILSGCGVYDGSEIHESVLTLLAIDKHGAQAVCFAPNIDQHHVINHIDGSEMKEKRNVLIEAARIARGAIEPLDNFDANEIDALVIPGGFGAAKNLSKWAFEGPNGEINEETKQAINSVYEAKKPIGAMCMGPTVVAKALAHRQLGQKLTVGTTSSPSPYDIEAISNGMNATGAKAQMAEVFDVVVDKENRIVTSPCYMMEASIAMINEGIEKCIAEMIELVD